MRAMAALISVTMALALKVLFGAELANAGEALLLLAGLAIGAAGVRRSPSPAT